MPTFDVPIVIDFAPHRIRYAGFHDDLLWIAVNEYPIAFGIDGEGRIVRTTDGVPRAATKMAAPDVVSDGRSIAWRGRQLTVANNTRGGDRFLHDWELGPHGLASAGPDAFVCIAPSRVVLVPFEWTPVGRVDVRRVKVALPEQPLEDATVFFAGPERVLVEHEKRGRFWFDASKTGLAKGDRVRLGGFFSEHGPLAGGVGEPQPWFAGPVAAHKLIATVLAYRDEIVRLPMPAVPDDGEAVHFGDAGAPPPAEPVRAPKKLEKLVTALVAHGLAPKQTGERLDELAESNGFTDDEDLDDDAAAAGVLAAIHEEKETGRAHGFIALDVRWGNSTDDLVGEFANALGDEGKTIAAAPPPNADRGESLDGFVRKLNAMLEAAGATRRIYELETGSDWSAHIARTPEEVATMKKRGIRGIRLP